MATAQSKLDILINAKNNASPAVKQIGGDLAGLDKSAGNLAKGLGGLAAGFGVAGLVALGGAAAGAAMEMSRLNAMSQDVEASMQGLAAAGGSSATSMLNGIREASRGAISDYDLMLTANRAMLLGVADNTKELTDLMDVARARSQALGITTAQAFGDIVTGIGRMSPLILDNLGIVVDQEAANNAYAASLGKVASQLTEQEKKQALVNAVIKDSADLVRDNVAAGDDAASNFERMDAAIANAKDALGGLFQPAMVVVADAIAKAAASAAEGMKEVAAQREVKQTAEDLFFAGVQARALAQEVDLLKGHMRDLEAVGKQNSATYRDYARELQVLESKLSAATVEANKLGSEQNRLANATEIADQHLLEINRTLAETAVAAQAGFGQVGLSATAAKERLASLEAQAKATQAAINGIRNSALGTLESAASSAVSIMGSSQVSQIYAEQKKRLDGQIKALEAVGYNTDELKFKSQELAEKAALPFTNAVEAAREAEKEGKAYAKTLSSDLTDAAREAEQAFSELQGTVEGVLRGALNPGVGVDPDEMLEKLGIPRADAINENARRLADIAANGLKGQDWLGAFQREVPDIWNMIRTASNPQEEAAHLLRDFQDGLLTSAIDKDKAKEIVRRQILGDRNMAEMAREIAGELAAEMGVPLQQALATAQGALGTGGGSGAGTEAAQSFSDGANLGMEESDGGGRMVDTFVSQMRASYSKLKNAGSDAGKEWGSSFIAAVGENVPPALINILTELVTPSVMSKFAQQGTLTGAAP